MGGKTEEQEHMQIIAREGKWKLSEENEAWLWPSGGQALTSCLLVRLGGWRSAEVDVTLSYLGDFLSFFPQL